MLYVCMRLWRTLVTNIIVSATLYNKKEKKENLLRNLLKISRVFNKQRIPNKDVYRINFHTVLKLILAIVFVLLLYIIIKVSTCYTRKQLHHSII